MNWFLIALITPITHAISNHFDKYLLSKYVKDGTVGALIIFSALFAVLALPVLYFVNPNVLGSVTVDQAIVLMINGAFLIIAILFYLYGLDTDEASYVAPFAQFIPLFGLILGYFILKETFSVYQIVAGTLILLGGVILSIDLGEKKGLKSKLFFYMMGATFFYALNGVIFKYIANEQGFTSSLFWDMAGKFVFGVLLFITIKSYQQEFINMLRNNGVVIFGLNVLNELITLAGEIALVYAVLLAPVALVQVVSGLQPAFALIIGVILTLFLPNISQESLEKKYLAQKIIGIVIISIGFYLLNTI